MMHDIFGSATKTTYNFLQMGRRTKMSEKQKLILENLSKSMANATESQEEYLLGYAECLAQSNKKPKRKRKAKK
jgi:hypothetical protein